MPRPVPPRLDPTRAEQMIKESEAAKARIYDVPGKDLQFLSAQKPNYYNGNVDEDYLVVGGFVDQTTRAKIGNGEYIDFAKLIQRDKVNHEDDHRMEMINKGDVSYWVPLSDREVSAITNFGRWEQAFRVFSNVYSTFHPERSGELIQYNHVIYTASQTCTWENVYRYNREFRMHMSKHHMHRSWGVILQQAWAMILKDKLSHLNNNYQGQHNQDRKGNNGEGPRRKLCFDYNRGICTFGKRCKFDHRCSFCKKYGHRSYCCRKAMKSGSSSSVQSPSNKPNGDRWEKYEREQAKK